MTFSDAINGLFALIIVIVSFICGVLICLKSREVKNKHYLFLGFTWSGIYQPWWGASVSFIYALFTQQTIPDQLYMFLGSFFIPIYLIPWIYGITGMILEDKRKILIIILTIISIPYNIYLVTSIIINPDIIGTIQGFDISYNLISIVYLMFINLTIVITGILFALDSRKSNNKKIKIQGIFLILAFISYFIGGLADSSPIGSYSNAILIIVRLILMIGSFFFYIGLFMPKIIMDLFKIEY